MISKVTIYTLLLALLVGTGIHRWSLQHPDNCDRYMAGDHRFPSSELVASGSRTIVVPCRDWFLRQPEKVQIVCLVDLLFAGSFVMNGLGDLRQNIQTWRARRR